MVFHIANVLRALRPRAVPAPTTATTALAATAAATLAISAAFGSAPPGTVPAQASPDRSATAAVEAAAADDPLRSLVAEALRVNPALRAARLESAAFREEAKAASALMPPRVGVELMGPKILPGVRGDLSEADYFVEQGFPWPGKRASRARPALSRAEAGDARARTMEIAVARDVKETYLELWLLAAKLRINAGNQALVRRLIEVARSQYEVGLGGQADILRAHAELAALSQQAVELAEGREAALAALNALLDRMPDSPIPVPDSLPAVPAPPEFARVLSLARSRHPALRAIDAEARAREAEAGAAGKELWPDLMVRGTWQDMREAPLHGGAPEDLWAVMVEVDLPFAFWSGSRHRSQSRAARARAEQSRLELRDEGNRLSARVRAALSRIRAAAEGLEVARAALVPHAEQALHGVQAAYNSGKASFLDVMDSYRVALGAREREAEAAAGLLRGRADLEAAAGMDYDDIIQSARTPGGSR